MNNKNLMLTKVINPELVPFFGIIHSLLQKPLLCEIKIFENSDIDFTVITSFFV